MSNERHRRLPPGLAPNATSFAQLAKEAPVFRPAVEDAVVVEETPPPVTEPPVLSNGIPEHWFPIAEAPRNGTVVLLYTEQVRHGIQGQFKPSRQCVQTHSGPRWLAKEVWIDPLTRKPIGNNWTHWSPL